MRGGRAEHTGKLGMVRGCAAIGLCLSEGAAFGARAE